MPPRPPRRPTLAPPAEFGLIARHFAPLAGAGGLGLKDDAAVFMPPPGRELVVSTDAIVEGVHFLPNDPPETVGRKLLRVNLSDLAAMGATPLAYVMTVSVPASTGDAWFSAFASGLAEDQAAFGITLLGGDTTSTPGPISLSATVLGHVAPGTAWLRSGAEAGDDVWVTGTIGDSALGLLAAQGRLPDPTGALVERYRLPRPRLGLDLAGIVHAAMDVSDGLAQDAGHVCAASGVCAVLRAAAIPLSAAARVACAIPGGEPLFATCLIGGDDYELLLAAPPAARAALRSACAAADVPVTRIGSFAPRDGLEQGGCMVSVLDEHGRTLALTRHGWSHF